MHQLKSYLLAAAFTLVGYICAYPVAADTPEYRMNAGDRISIRVYGESDLNVDAMLDESGSINYPFLGELKVTGLTPSELESLIVKGLEGDYLINPSVTVSIAQYRQVFIFGEVQVPGGYSYQPGLTVGKAAALAQGLTERGSESRIFLTREGKTDEERERVNMSTKLKPGDVVTIEQGFF
ncbi:polysaccharide biosynthesis/export family protein [Microbulbifer hydrolyticus]|uniref:Polysaccharide export outer membrane protein n=1 Tax=Microbulbifer hydrolyticus TaxID=48074 RepID=A0A6P1TFZ3_9GAMM|nr:polysaccharide biosynthesis/export family protein [Microbulbifer hydrolyticus]MBB5211857.1 polysaccharide export outer membrane protein [Microbulbifer hydrolyticus]QHQ40555.1 polysaccharide export protein [Microbulbifer hydrolyticus]